MSDTNVSAGRTRAAAKSSLADAAHLLQLSSAAARLRNSIHLHCRLSRDSVDSSADVDSGSSGRGERSAAGSNRNNGRSAGRRCWCCSGWGDVTDGDEGEAKIAIRGLGDDEAVGGRANVVLREEAVGCSGVHPSEMLNYSLSGDNRPLHVLRQAKQDVTTVRLLRAESSTHQRRWVSKRYSGRNTVSPGERRHGPRRACSPGLSSDCE